MPLYAYSDNDHEGGDGMAPVSDERQALMSFKADMFISGDKDNTFRVKNKSLSDWERRIVLERLTKATEIRCHLLDVVHGTLSRKAGSDLATLMVFKFRFDSVRHARRLVRARVDIEFFAKDAAAGGEAPTVLAMAPDERWAVVPTVDREEWTAGASASAGAPGVPAVDLGAEASLQKTWSRDISDATTVTGGPHFGEGIDAGAHTACGWTILENRQRETGLPDSLTVAVLVGRQTDEQFNAVVNLEARGSFRTKMDWMFSKIPVDDPVLFNPAIIREGEEVVDSEEEEEQEQGQERGLKGPGDEWEGQKGEDGEEVVDGGYKPQKERRKVTARRYGRNRLGKWETRMDDLADVTFRTVYHNSEKDRF